MKAASVGRTAPSQDNRRRTYGLFKQLKKALLERALGAELSDHLGYEKGDPAGHGTGNNRNGHSGKTVLTEDAAVNLAVPRDRKGTFEPAIVPKRRARAGSTVSTTASCPSMRAA